MTANSNSLREFIEGNRYDYVAAGNDWYRLRFNGKNGDYNMFAQVTEDPGQMIMVFTYCPVKIPDHRRSMVADYLNRVNYGLFIGCLEMDPADGVVRSRSTAPLGPGEPGPGVLTPLFDSSFYLIENWLPGLLRVAFGSEEASSAYANMLEMLNSRRNTETEGADGDEPDSEFEGEPELTTIEQEVSRLLADRDCDSESSPLP